MSLAEKYDNTKTWEEPCKHCERPVTMTASRFEALGVYHTGCFGWPACGCPMPHQGECSSPKGTP